MRSFIVLFMLAFLALTSSMTMSEVSRIRAQLRTAPNTKWGFVIYRCTYGDDEKWKAFMQILNGHTFNSLDFEHADNLKESLDWAVQEDPSLDGASRDEVRRRFKQWVAASGKPPNITPRYGFCVHVDAASLESVLAGPKPPDLDLDSVTYVNLIDMSWAPPDPATYDWEAMGKDPVTDDPADEGEAEVEGSKLYDVGWMKVNAAMLAPRTYNVMGGSGWHANYRRPPKVAMP